MFAKFKDGADVGMVERGRRARLAAETFLRLCIAAHVFGQEFQRHLPAQLEVFGTVDHAHAAPADNVQYAIVRNRPASQRGGPDRHRHRSRHGRL